MKRTHALTLLLLASWPSCKCGEKPKDAPADAAPAKDTRPPDDGPGSGEVEPVYKETGQPPDPTAVRLCNALHQLPADRRETCCGYKVPAMAFGGECVRTLTAAILAGGVKLNADGIARCEEAMKSLHDGCDWIGPWPQSVSPQCFGLITGTVAEGEVCRSNLECQGTLRCHGLGATSAGRCGKPRPTGGDCSTANDPLAVYTRQDRTELEHPECEGFCIRNHCADFVAVGGGCDANVQCGPGRYCAKDKCAAGEHAKIGDACADTGCEPGARCIDHLCIKPKAGGEKCASDLECRGACTEADGGAGSVCGMRCEMKIPTTPRAVHPTKAKPR